MADTKQKVALVTGAARGIGLAAAKRFLADGWRVALLDIDNETLTRTYAALGQPDATLALHCDVADPAAVTRAFAAAAQRFSRLDALVNNAGIAVFKPLLETTLDDWQRTLAVNLTGAFLCVQAAAPQMREQAAARSSTSPRSLDFALRRCASPTAPPRRRWRT